MVEQGTHKPLVASSNLALGTIDHHMVVFYILYARFPLRGISQAQQILPLALNISDPVKTRQMRLVLLFYDAGCYTSSNLLK